MKSNIIKGSVNIVVGLMLLVFLALSAISVRMGTLTVSQSYYDYMGQLGVAMSAMETIFTIFAIISIVAAILLLILGVAQIFSYKPNITKRAEKIVPLIVGVIFIVAGLFAIIEVASSEGIPGVVEARIGAGSIMLIILGILTIIAPFIIQMITKEKTSKTKTNEPTKTPTKTQI